MNVSYKKGARQYKLLDTAFELHLSKPTNSQIARLMLFHEDCTDAQRENNYSFLARVEELIYNYIYKCELDFQEDNEFDGGPDCGCDYDCECSLNAFVIPTFKNIASQLYSDREKHCALLNIVLADYTAEEQLRLLDCNLTEILRIMMYKSLSYLSYDLGFYDVSLRHHEVAVLIYGGIVSNSRFDEVKHLEENEILSRNYKKIGAKGGAQKGINYQEPKEKALNYHDKYFSKKNDKGKFIYSADKAAEEIIEHFTQKKESLGYAVRSLSNIISKHRNGQNKS